MLDLEDPEEFTRLVGIVKGFSNDTRLALLLGFYRGYTAKEIAEFLDMTRGGLQNNIRKMIDQELVYRPAEEGSPTYRLTPIGEFFARLFATTGPTLLAAVDSLSQAEAEIRQQIKGSPMADGLTQSDEEKLVHTKKWQQVRDQINEELGLDIEDPLALEEERTPRAYAFESGLSEEDQDDNLNEDNEE